MIPSQKLIAAIAAALATASANPVENPDAVEPRAAPFTGDLTFYEPGLGACGVTNDNGDNVVAVSQLLFDHKTPGGNPNKNPLCGRKINVHHGGKTQLFTVQDRCTGCKLHDLDATVTFFEKFTSPDKGRIPITWTWA
ncbi:Uu.00g093230.m01.CDS01 [Anthostomella pinea]|uniref:Uu.00g093230.m01.CDS01 n=1 Tax=Anthostomella pinea TaxID=933095 RepID=A0AAI8VP37_9PEZI|nr:Uu.00g093230.m01.CDS01 [Anthostomella pinea]